MSCNIYHFEKLDIKKENVFLLGDGFFARGFLHHINYNKFNVIQFYKDKFINPQDLMYSLQENKKYEGGYHFRDLFYKKPTIEIQEEIKELEISKIDNNQSVKINNRWFEYNYLVVGLGAQKTLKDWSNEINQLVNKKNMSIGIIGMGPIGIELGTILSNQQLGHRIDMFDMLDKSKVLGYVSEKRKVQLLDMLEKYNISTTYGSMYKPENYYHDKTFFCVGTRPNNLISKLFPVVNNNLQVPNTNIFIGGDCATTPYIKTGQVAYQQGAYVAKKLNGDIPADQPFEYKSNGMSLNIGNGKALIEGNKYVPDGIYPDLAIKMYSLFFV